MYFRKHILMVEVTDLPECLDLSANTTKGTEVIYRSWVKKKTCYLGVILLSETQIQV